MTSENKQLQVAVLATLDTKHLEAAFLGEQISAIGLEPVFIDVGVVGHVPLTAQYPRAAVAAAGGTSLDEILQNPTREAAGPVMAAGATTILNRLVAEGEVASVVAVGGTQGTSLCSQIMQSLPYGFPKIMVSTAASGDTSPFVGIKDITMMFSVSDLVGLNPLTRIVLANAASAACGMARYASTLEFDKSKPVVAMTNLGVLTEGALFAQKRLESAGFEVIVFHAVGSGGRAMEQMMKEGMITAVFDYAMGEIADELYDGLRSSGPERMTVAGKLGLPQVIVPGGAEHLGLFVSTPNEVPAAYRKHKHVFHSPVIFVPRLNGDEARVIAESVGKRLASATGPLAMFLPEGGTSRYSKAGGELFDPEADSAFFTALEECVPESCEVVRLPFDAEDPQFVAAAVDRLIAMIK